MYKKISDLLRHLKTWQFIVLMLLLTYVVTIPMVTLEMFGGKMSNFKNQLKLMYIMNKTSNVDGISVEKMEDAVKQFESNGHADVVIKFR